MSSSFVVEPRESASKKDDTLIIVVNDDGTISVDEKTLQNLIMNQSDANVSVVRVGQTEGDAANGDLTLTVDPPAFERTENQSSAITSGSTTDVAGLVDPFMEMDPEQLEKLETALQSEQAKQILGENVTAMLDMLTVEEQQKSIKYCIELDHCYTSRSSPTDPEPSDPLPIANSPDIDDFEYKHSGSMIQQSSSSSSLLLPSSAVETPNNNADITTAAARSKLSPRILTRTVVSRGRKISISGIQQQIPGSTQLRNSNVSQQSLNKAVDGLSLSTSSSVTPAPPPSSLPSINHDAEPEEDQESTTSSESSESEPPSDDDSDFGPRGPRRGSSGGSVRARGRKGLTTRGGSMTALRRRAGTNKQMDMDQVRRLDMEMAAAVDAMKSPDKLDRPEKFKPVKGKKQMKNRDVSRKKETEGGSRTRTITPKSPIINDPPMIIAEKPLQTTNQVKANLISANMIKGDMILTKPGQSRNNQQQKVLFVQKRVMVRANDVRNIGMKKQQSIFVTKDGMKTMPMKIQTKLGTSDDGKLVSMSGKTLDAQQEQQQQTMTTATIVSPTHSLTLTPTVLQQSPQIKSIPPSPQPSPTPLSQFSQIQNQTAEESTLQQSVKTSIPGSLMTVKAKTTEAKKEKKKSESESPQAKIEESLKPVESKTPDVSKKHLKKEPRKSPAVLAVSLGPALFSTPDIIRRVGSESKISEIPGTLTTTALVDSSSSSPSNTMTIPIESDLPLSQNIRGKKIQEDIGSISTNKPIMHEVSADLESLVKIPSEDDASLAQISDDSLKPEAKISAEQLEPSLEDPVTKTPLAADTPELTQTAAVHLTPAVPNQIISEHSGIEGEEHLLATLEMEAGKHEDELLAEALLLQEQLGVDLSDHAALEPTASIPEPILADSFDTPMEIVDKTETKASMKVSESIKFPESPIVIAPTPITPIVVEPLTIPKETIVQHKKRDDKEPIQIIRGGRVITLPPIEAPATRSKRLQAKPETPPKLPQLAKKEADKTTKQVQHQLIPHRTKEIELGIKEIGHQADSENEVGFDIGVEKVVNDDDDEDDDDDDDDDDHEENSDSEDDPDRLWCICKRPHNNRFMICCDVCEDWFHGKCVHVSKAMGQQMEEKGIEWVCPNCMKKKEQESVNTKKKKPQQQSLIPGKASKNESVSLASSSAPSPTSASSSQLVTSTEQSTMVQKTLVPSTSVGSSTDKIVSATVVAPDSSNNTLASTLSVTQCVVCKKEARNSSIYCSDACILMHAQETFTKESKPSTVATTQITGGQMKIGHGPSDSQKSTTDARVIVFERRTGKVLTGNEAPTTSNLKIWLKENPTFEVVRPNNLNTLQIGGKTVTAIQTHGTGKLTNKNIAQQATSPGGQQTKMIYAKVMGSKQTVLAPSNKKLVVLSGGQPQRASISPKTIQQKQQVSGKSPSGLRQTTIKVVTSQQAKSPTIVTNTKQTMVKKQEVVKATGIAQPQKIVTKTPPAKKAEPEPIRLNVRKTLAESLTIRIKESKDLRLSDDEINSLALSIELELYKYFRDTGTKYKAKYRSLVFNIKDTKNLTLFRKIADRSLTPDAVVRLSPDEMASQELAEWREKETKHQLEMIKKNELDLMAQAKSIVVKTHKGELIIENEGNIDHVDPKTPVQDIVTVLNSHELGGINEENKIDKIEKVGSEDSKRPLTIKIPAVIVDDKKKLKEEKERTREKDKERSTRGKRDQPQHEEKKSHRSRSQSRRSRDRERSKDRRSTNRSTKESKREREKNRERDKGAKESREKDNKARQQRKSRSSGKGSKRDYKDNNKGGGGGLGKDENVAVEPARRDKSEDKKTVISMSSLKTEIESEKPIEERLWRHVEEETHNNANTSCIDGNDSDLSDREPSSTVNIKTPDINEETPETVTPEPSLQEQTTKQQSSKVAGASQTVWRGFVSMVDVAKFFITAQEVSGQAKDLMEDLPDTVDVVGRISHETVWDYISKMKKTGSKEILIIRLTAANDEEKIPYITLYSYLNSRSRLGVVGNVSKNIKDFYIMPFSRQSDIPPVLLPFVGPGFEEQRPHLLLGIIVSNKRKRVSSSALSLGVPAKILKKDPDDLSTKEKINSTVSRHHQRQTHSPSPDCPRPMHKGLLLESLREKQTSNVTQMTLESLNKAHIGMSARSIIDNAAISKLVPELSLKLDLTDSPVTTGSAIDPIVDEIEDDDGDEPYSPGGDLEPEEPPILLQTSTASSTNIVDVAAAVADAVAAVASSASSASSILAASSILSPPKNSTELQRKMDELNRQIEEQKQQIQSISSSFLGDATTDAAASTITTTTTTTSNVLPGLCLDLEAGDMDEAYSPTDARSFTPPPPGIAKYAQPILDKVSDITIPPNLQEILANVKRQESSKVDPYLPSKPSATFLTSTTNSSLSAGSSSLYTTKPDKYTPTFIKNNSAGTASSGMSRVSVETCQSSMIKEQTKSTLRSLSDLDLIKKAEEELAAVAAADAVSTSCKDSIINQNELSQQTLIPSPMFSPPPPLSQPPPPLPPSPPPLMSVPPPLISVPPPLLSVPPPTCNNSSIFTEPDVPTVVEDIVAPLIVQGAALQSDNEKRSSLVMEQPKPPGLEDEELPIFPTTPPPPLSVSESTKTSPQKFVPKSGIVLSVKRKISDDGTNALSPVKTPRTKSRWGQGPTE